MTKQATTFRSIFKSTNTYALIQQQRLMGLPLRYAEEFGLELARQLNESGETKVTQDEVREVLVAEFE